MAIERALCGERKRMNDGLRQRLASLNAAPVDLSRSDKRPEQHRRRFAAEKVSLRLGAAFEFFVQLLDRVRCARWSTG